MEFAYRSRKHIAVITLVSLVLILLLTANFTISDGTYSKGNLEKIIVNQSKELEHCILSNNNWENATAGIQIKQLLDTGFIGIIMDSVLLWFTCFICIYRSKLSCVRRYTLVSLRVRMDE